MFFRRQMFREGVTYLSRADDDNFQEKLRPSSGRSGRML
jgi:hypothetical protein